MPGVPRLAKILAAVPLVVAVATIILSGTAAADPVTVRGGGHEGYGRLVFNWPAPVSYEASLNGDRLTLRFGRPLEGSVTDGLGPVREYVRRTAVIEGGLGVVLDLTRAYGLRHFSLGSAVVVDFLDAAEDVAPEAGGTAAPGQATAAPRGTTSPTVPIRTGEHKDFSRIVFDWPRTVDYRVSQEGTQVSVSFQAPGRLALAGLRAGRPTRVSRVEGSGDGPSPSVMLTVPAGVGAKGFRVGPKIVVDLRDGTAASPPPSPPSSPPPLPPPSQTDVASTAPAEPAEAEAPEPTAAPVEAVEVAAIESTAPAETPPAAAPAEAPPATAPAEASSVPPAQGPPADTAVAATTESAPSDSPGTVAAPTAEAASGKPDSVAALGGPRPLDLTPPNKSAADPEGTGVAEADSAEQVPQGENDVVVDFRFDWEEPVAAAVFHRAGALWVVFDKARAVDLAALQQRGGNLVRAVDSLPVERATVLRLDTVAGVNPSLRRDGLAWILEFRQQAFQVATPIETLPQPNSPIGSRVFLPVTEPGRAIPLVDPAIGDNLVAVPVVPLGHGISQARRFPQFQLLPTIQGIVVRPRIDDLRVRTLRQGVELTSAGGLSISSISARVRADLTIGSLRPLTRVFDLESWRNLTIEDFNETKQELQQVVARSSPDERESRRLDLARFYFAMGFEAESLGVLESVRRERPEIEELPEFRAMRGATSMMMGRQEDAAADLNHASLDDNDEGVFWRAALKAQTGDPVGAAATLKRKGGIVRPYPKPLKMPLGLVIADTAITVGDIRLAQQYLQVLANDEPDETQQAQIDYVTGRMAELAGDFDGAIIKWESVIDSRHRSARANAARARAELLMKTDEITRAAGIEILEGLRFAWRGDDFEFTLLRRLGDLYLAEERYREGLRTLRQAATYFREHEDASAVTQKMAETFSAMYMDDKADAIAPVSAIALYEEFKELTPAGERGDEMVRRFTSVRLKNRINSIGWLFAKRCICFRLPQVLDVWAFSRRGSPRGSVTKCRARRPGRGAS